MPNLTIHSKALAYGDQTTSNNPLRRYFDWTRQLNISIGQPRQQEEYIIAGSSKTFFDGSRTLTTDGTSAFSSELSSLSADRYRFTWTGGTNPTLRTDRALTLDTRTVTVTVNSDQTVTFSLSGGTFGSVVAGDTVFIPHTSTGDTANVLSLDNAGFWTVLAVASSTSIQCSRPTGEDFLATGEAIALTANSQFQAFSASGVQPGDSVSISAGFATATQRTFTVDRVTATWFEVVTSSAIPEESAKTPGAAGLVFYTDAKRFLRVEADQETVLRLNGASGNELRVSPEDAGSVEMPGYLELLGPVWSLTAVNMSSSPVTVTVMSAERSRG